MEEEKLCWLFLAATLTWNQYQNEKSLYYWTNLQRREIWRNIDRLQHLELSAEWKVAAIRTWSSPDGTVCPKMDSFWLQCWQQRSIRYRPLRWRKCRRTDPVLMQWSLPVSDTWCGNWRSMESWPMCQVSLRVHFHRVGWFWHLWSIQ